VTEFTKKTINLLQEFSIPLITGVVLVLIWANISPESYLHIIENEIMGDITLHFLVNEIFMVFFFAIATIEIIQSLLPGGDLHPVKRVVNPICSTFGGVIGPVVVYLVLNYFIGSNEFTSGWGIPTATDIALAWIVAKFIFGPNHPAVSFLLLIAIIDDGIGLIIIAVFYPDPVNPVIPAWLILTAAGMILAYMFNKKNIKSYWPYILFSGALSWFGLYLAHIHAALALVFIMPFLPRKQRETVGLFEATPMAKSTLENFENEFKIFVDFGLLVFGLTNAGVTFSSINQVTWLVYLALIIGKTGGIYITSFISTLFGFSLPKGMNKKDLFVAGIVSSLGLTVALFLAGTAFSNTNLQGAAKMGALISSSSAVVAFIISKLLKIKKSCKLELKI